MSKYCQCRDSGNCKLNVAQKKQAKKAEPMYFDEEYDGFKKNIFKVNPNEFIELERERERSKIEKKMQGLYEDDQSFELIEQG